MRIRLALAVFVLLAAITALCVGPVLGAQAVTPSPKTYYFTWFDSTTANGMAGDWIVIGNLEDHAATAQVFFGNESSPRETFNIGAKGRAVATWPNTAGGPVRVVSPDGATLVVTQRVLFNDSFNEVPAVEESNLDTTYHFTWYDSLAANGMKGNWILVANADQQPAQVDVFIGNERVGSYTIPVGGFVTEQYPGRMGGPVRVVSTNSQRLVVSQRVLCNDGFNEVMGVPARELDSIYFFTRYDMKVDSGMKGNWILISNDNDTAVHAEVFIGPNSTPRGTYTIGPHQSVTPTYPELMDGPVRVVCKDCTGGKKILVSQRILYRDCFEEVQGTAPGGLSDEQYFGWYDFKAANSMNGNWLLIANQGVGNAVVDVYIGASPTPIASYNIGEGNRVTPQFPEVMDGPVRVLSRHGQPLMVSQRVLYKDSFNELLGLTKTDVGQPLAQNPDLTIYKHYAYWDSVADYNAGLLSVSLRLANMGQADAFNASITGISATNGVTVASAIPLYLGDMGGGGGYWDFTAQYSVPQGVTSFRTSVEAQCQDGSGTWYYYP
jgi:hypothetical protein